MFLYLLLGTTFGVFSARNLHSYIHGGAEINLICCFVLAAMTIYCIGFGLIEFGLREVSNRRAANVHQD